MKKRFFIVTVSALAGLFGTLQAAHFTPTLTLAQADEIDEEIQSTIGTDPEYRGRRAPKASPAPASEPTPAPSNRTTNGGESEEGEWQTMHSENGRPYRGSSGGGGGGGGSSGWSAIKVDTAAKRIYTPKISFGSNSANPTPQSQAVLRQLASTLSKKSDLSVRIEGHTDTIGYDQANLELSQKRADKVKDILTQNGVDASRLQAVGMGDRHPIASSVTADGQEKNRRVEFHLMDGAAPAATPTMPAAPVMRPAAPPPPPPTPAPAPAAPPPPPPAPVAAAPAAPPPPPPPAPAAAAPAPAPAPAPGWTPPAPPPAK